jgi:hypothetical protein
MINFKKLAESISESFARKIYAREDFNSKLLNLAKEHEINLPKNTNLMSLAYKAAKDAGADNDYYEAVAWDAVTRLIFPGLTEDEKKFDFKYLKFQMLPNVVVNLKAKGLTFEEIIENDWIVKLSKEYSILDLSYLKKFFTGEKIPTKKISPDKVMQGKKIRDVIFKNYNPSKGSFTTLWYNAVKNMAINILDSTKRTEDALNHAIRIQPRNEERQDGISEDKLKSDNSHTKSEAKLIKKELFREAEKLNPLYLKSLELMSNGYDILAKSDKSKFVRELNLDENKYDDFVKIFVQDLAKILKKLELSSYEEAEQIITAKKKIASKILLKLSYRQRELKDNERELTWREYKNFNPDESGEYDKANKENRLVVDEDGSILHYDHINDSFPALVGNTHD